MSPRTGDRPVAVRAAGHVGATVVRLILLVLIAAATGILMGTLFLPAGLAANDVLGAVRTNVFDLAPLGEADRPPENSFIYDADGHELAELTFEENRNPVSLDEVPQVVIDAVLATEDASFYDHEGVNHLAIVRAALTNWRAHSIESGASTITQQYVKMAFLTPEQTLQRKIEEAIYAIQLEDRYSKNEILERYLNRAYFGSGTYGVGTAAQRYFSKDIGEVSLGEAAMLAGLLRAPEANNPINSMENAQTRRDIVLGQMATHGFVSPDQAQAARDEPLEVRISEPPPPEHPFWTAWVSRLLYHEEVAASLGSQVDVLDVMGASREERIRTVFQQGLRIHTTLDPELQDQAEASLREYLTYEDEPAAEIAQEPMGALVSVEPDGAIRAMALGPREYGSCTEDDSWAHEDEDTGQLFCDRTTVNPAVPSPDVSGRQPGSSFKPFVAAAALEEGISPGVTLDARGPQDIEGLCHEPWLGVGNTGGNAIINMYDAMAQSSNVFHALLVAEIGPAKLVDMAQRLGITSNLPEVCPLALGAGEVSPLEMASAFATLFNRGENCQPFAITRIEDRDGNVIWEHAPECEQVVDEQIADRVVDLMAGVVEPGGTARVANLGQWPTRGKTGTTDEYIDAWFVGGVRQLATAAWIGYENGARFYATPEQAAEVCGSQRWERGSFTQCPPSRSYLRNVTIGGQFYPRVFGGTIAAPMWAHYMAEAVQRYEPEAFPDPGSIPTGEVPDLLEAGSISEAEELAIEAGFRVRFDEVEHYRPAGTFIEQTPAPGSRAGLGSIITVDVSDGTGALPAIPDVRGMTLDDAAEVLFDLGFRVGQRSVDVDDEDLDGVVVDQDPAPGTPADPDDLDMIVLNVGTFVEPDDEDPPEQEEDSPDDQPGPPGGSPPGRPENPGGNGQGPGPPEDEEGEQ